MTSRRTKLVMGLGALALVAGCDAAPHQTAKSAPSSAYECLKDIYDNPNSRQAVIATGGGLSAGASIAIALISGAASSAVASEGEVRRLKACYDSVGASPSERLPLDAATKRHDSIIEAGGSPSEARRSIISSAPCGPNGGAGFSTF